MLTGSAKRHAEPTLCTIPADCVVLSRPPAKQITLDVVADDSADRDLEGSGHPQHGPGEIGPQHPPPTPQGQPSVGEKQESHPDQRDAGRPSGLGEHRHPAERQAAVPEPVVSHGIEAGILAEREEERDAKDDPAEGVTRLSPGHDEAHHPEGRRVPDRHGTATGGHALVRETGQRRIGHHQGQHDNAEDQRGRWRPSQATSWA
jgi:hypothetical protein